MGAKVFILSMKGFEFQGIDDAADGIDDAAKKKP